MKAVSSRKEHGCVCSHVEWFSSGLRERSQQIQLLHGPSPGSFFWGTFHQLWELLGQSAPRGLVCKRSRRRAGGQIRVPKESGREMGMKEAYIHCGQKER